MHLKMSSGKWRPFCHGLNVLIEHVSLVFHWEGCQLLAQSLCYYMFKLCFHKNKNQQVSGLKSAIFSFPGASLCDRSVN